MTSHLICISNPEWSAWSGVGSGHGGGCLVPGGAWPGGTSGSGGCLVLGGAWSQGGGVVSQHALRQTPPPVNRIADACETRMHSSRMCTGQTLTVFQSLLFRGGSGPGGVWSWGVSGPGGIPAYLPGRGWVYLPGLGGSLVLGGWGYVPAWSGTPPPVDRILDITLVKILPCPIFVADGN